MKYRKIKNIPYSDHNLRYLDLQKLRETFIKAEQTRDEFADREEFFFETKKKLEGRVIHATKLLDSYSSFMINNASITKTASAVDPHLLDLHRTWDATVNIVLETSKRIMSVNVAAPIESVLASMGAPLQKKIKVRDYLS